jgi:superfamily I DNA/RNA helicase
MQVVAPGTLAPGRRLRALAAEAGTLVIHEAASDRAEAEFIAHTIEKALGGASFFALDSGRADGVGRRDLSFCDFAVLYRIESQADAIAEALHRSGLPFQRRSHRGLLEEPGVRELVGAMAALGGGTVAERLEQAAAGSEALRPVLPLLREPAASAASVEEFRSLLAMGVDVDLYDPRAEGVALLTLHASKGLEFPVVFVAGCEDGLLPLRFGGDAEPNLDEERRLLFVGMTRARQALYLSHARKRLWRGELRLMQPSPYLAEIREELLQRSATPKRATGDQQLSLF